MRRTRRPIEAAPDLGDGHSFHLHQLRARSLAPRDANRGFGDSKPLGKKRDQFGVRGTSHRRCGEPNLQRPAVRARKLSTRRPRLNADGETDSTLA